MYRFNLSLLLWLIVAFNIMFFTFSKNIEAFPFQNFNIGDQVPAVTFSRYNAPNKTSFVKYKGQPLVILFWGADIAEKKQRSVKVLAELEKLKSFLKERHVSLLSVNIQGDTPLIIRQVLQESGSTEPVYIDAKRSAYGDLGIYVMPAILLLNKDGQVAAGLGYSRDLLPKLKGEIEILLNEKTRAQVQEDLQPQMAVKQPEKIKANIHLNAGLHLLKRGFPSQAKRELEKAIGLDPQLAAAQIELGCLYLDTGDSTKARKALQIGLQIQTDSLHGRICQAQLDALQADRIVSAINDLEELAAAYPAAPEPLYILGTIHEKQRRYGDAVIYYKKAHRLLQNRQADTGHAK